MLNTLEGVLVIAPPKVNVPWMAACASCKMKEDECTDHHLHQQSEDEVGPHFQAAMKSK